jgi:hypothetical protein
MSWIKIKQALLALANAHPQVNSFGTGDPLAIGTDNTINLRTQAVSESSILWYLRMFKVRVLTLGVWLLWSVSILATEWNPLPRWRSGFGQSNAGLAG